MKLWLKCGLIFLIINIILILIDGLFFGDFFGYYSNTGDTIDLIIKVPGEIFLSPLGITDCIYQSLLGEDYSWCPKRLTLDFYRYFSTVIFYFLLGAILGLIIEKVKSKKK
ncbi:hypothetical protein J4221_00755 [Candidatus Pacearchaeota archaeon]|nr:hypothetical protein [Candidatus Pacearchaeota archaeon]